MAVSKPEAAFFLQ